MFERTSAMHHAAAFVAPILGALISAACGSHAQQASGSAGAGSMADGGHAGRAGAGGGGTGGAAGISGVAGSGAGGWLASAAGSGSTSGGAPAVPDDLQRLVTAFCVTAKACCAKLSAQPAAECESGLLRSQPLSWVLEGTNALDTAKLSGCISAIEAARTGCAARPIYAACRGLIPATKHIGDVCLLNHQGYECGADGDNSVCDQVTDDTGICVEVKHAGEGQPCEFDCSKASGCPHNFDSRGGDKTEGCFESDGLRCSAYFPSVCATPLAQGADCDVTNQCAFSDLCRTNEGELTGTTCQAPLQLGDTCFGTCAAFTCKARVCVEPSFGEPDMDISCLGVFPTFRAIF
jgi:hypothetical protein